MRFAFASLLLLSACAGTPDVTPVNKALLAPPPAAETLRGRGASVAKPLAGWLFIGRGGRSQQPGGATRKGLG